MNKLDKIIEQNNEILEILKKKNPNRVAHMKKLNKSLPRDHYRKAGIESVKARKLSTHLPDRD